MKLQRSIKRQSITRLLLSLMVIIMLNIIGSFLFYRLDLTAEKRFTLSQNTRQFLKKLDDVVYIKIYLEGDFPAGFRRLRNETKEMLDEFRAYAGDNIQYEFVDPSANPDQTERNKLYQQLAQKGLQPTNLQEKGKGEASEKIVFPGAIVTYRAQEFPLMLLKSQVGAGFEEMLNNSIQTLEYNLTNVIRKITTTQRAKIGILQGHGELNKMEIADFVRSLSEFYNVDSVTLHGRLHALDPFKALIIARPDSAFDEKDKFLIDQFIMHGGKVLWLIDRMVANMDSLKNKDGSTIGFARDLNIDDQLFRYGVRINPDLIEDLYAAPILVTTGYIGNQPQQKVLPWFYFPLIVPTQSHPIVKNLNSIRLEFASSIDTIGIKGIKKNILLTTSPYCKILHTPVRISLGMMRLKPDQRQYDKSFLPVAVLLEGKFTSVYKNRLPPVLAENKEINFQETSINTSMIVVSDGDVARNDVKKGTGMIYPLGFDRITRQTYGNKTFLLNCVDYMCDDSGLLTLRSKEVKLRLLDHSMVESQKFRWELINTAGPLALIAGIGAWSFYRRRKKYKA